MDSKSKDLAIYRYSLSKETLANAIAYFNKTYVASDIFPREMGKKIGRIKMMREESDYSDFFAASEEDAKKQYETAQEVVTEVGKYLERQKIL